MLNGDPETGTEGETPLFRMNGTGKEITYGESRDVLWQAMSLVGIAQEGLRLQSLRVEGGGEAACAKFPSGGELGAGCMGIWRPNAVEGYIQAGKRKLEKAG